MKEESAESPARVQKESKAFYQLESRRIFLAGVQPESSWSLAGVSSHSPGGLWKVPVCHPMGSPQSYFWFRESFFSPPDGKIRWLCKTSSHGFFPLSVKCANVQQYTTWAAYRKFYCELSQQLISLSFAHIFIMFTYLLVVCLYFCGIFNSKAIKIRFFLFRTTLI
jgi:hypothetical protein